MIRPSRSYRTPLAFILAGSSRSKSNPTSSKATSTFIRTLASSMLTPASANFMDFAKAVIWTLLSVKDHSSRGICSKGISSTANTNESALIPFPFSQSLVGLNSKRVFPQSDNVVPLMSFFNTVLSCLAWSSQPLCSTINFSMEIKPANLGSFPDWKVTSGISSTG